MTEISAMYEALDNMDDYALMANVKPIGPHKVLTDAIAELEQLCQRVQELEERRCEVCGYAEHHREHTGCLRVKVKELTAERDALKQLYESSEESVLALKETRNRLVEERDALKQQRDDLVAALEQFATWGRAQHKAQSKGCHATFDMMALKDEIDLAEAAIASVKEKA